MNSKFNAVSRRIALLTIMALLVAGASLASFGQQLTGTLSGTAFDQSGAAVPDAKVTMKNDASGDVRDTVSNSSGNFAITAVQPGTYTITVSAAGFQEWKEGGVTFHQGDNRTLPNIKLQVGQANSVVEVTAGDVIVPVDTAEVSTSLNTQMIEDVPLGGRDAGELLKLMPGMALTNGINQGSSFNAQVTGTNSGPVGAYSANGTQPNGAMAFMLDGANLVDPGNAGTQIANINQDMVSEVKVLMSSYSAEYAKGPVIFQAFSKSGGSQYHGEGYFYARNSTFNSIDAYTHSQIANKNTPYNVGAPYQSFYYMGGNVGGPLFIPHTGINKSHHKLFFWAGYEYMRQHPAGSIINYNVPTLGQRAGDFTNAGVPAGAISAWSFAYAALNSTRLPAGTTTTSCDKSNPPNCYGTIPTGDYDPIGAAYLSLIPKPNETPNSGNGWNNFQYVSTTPQNRWEATGKVDYAISDNSKISVSYTRQIEKDQHPVGIWWTPPWTLPYPSNVVAATTSQEFMSNFTHVFSPTTTNEFVFTLARYINPNTLANAAAVDRTKLGINVTGLFGYTTKQIPNLDGPWGGSFPDISEMNFEGNFNGHGFGAEKIDPALYDNFTKVLGPHTLKGGFYWDTSGNHQSSEGIGNGGNGTYNLGWGSSTTGNTVADFLLGSVANYQQPSKSNVQVLHNHQWSLYAQDSYKTSRRLTLNYGLRFDHVGQIYGPPNGLQVWDPASYVNTSPGPNNTGLLYHAINSSIPISGMVSPLFYYEPRVGAAYDLFGNGKTVIRGGFAVFHYQFAVNDVGGPAAGPAGIFTYTTNSTAQYVVGNPNTGYHQIDSGAPGFTPPSAAFQNGSSISAFQRGDNRTPYTMDYNFTVSQAVPWRSVFELSYVGNKSKDELINGNNGKLDDLNNVPIGAFFGNDPTTGKPVSPNNGSFNANHYRPLVNYQDVYLITHGSYANYNSMQVSWQKQSGPVTFLTNYTFSKVMGIRDGQTDNGAGNGSAVDPFTLRNNYGPLAYDHTHILNFAYNWNLPKPIHGSRFLQGAVNGWQLSGYTTFQSGAPIQPNLGGNLNTQYPSNYAVTMPNGLTATGVSASDWFGTNAIQNVLPVLTCDPRSGLRSGQYFNPNCFAPPAYGHQGTLIWPYVKGPSYFDSDLGLFKNFKINERQNVQFRVSATNFLNHPLPQFGLAGSSDESLNFTGANSSILSQTNTNATTTGTPKFKTGSRQVTFAFKYYF